MYYNSEISGLITEDSYDGEDKDPLSLNLYTYCANDSVNQADPSGHCWITYSAKRKNAYIKEHGDIFIHIRNGFRKVYTPAGTYDEKPCKQMWDAYCDYKGINESDHLAEKMDVNGMNLVQASAIYEDDRSEAQRDGLENGIMAKAGSRGSGKSTRSSGVKGANKTNPLANIKYTDKVKTQMKKGDYHGFPKSVEGFGANGTVSKIKGGDKVTRTKVEIEGNYKGKDGVFEYIIEPGGVTCNHRLFKPNK